MADAQLMDSLRTAAQAASDKKAFQIVGFEVSDLTSYTDSLLICSGASDRQVAAIADAVQRQLRDAGRRPLHVEGERRADWVLLDYGEFVIHVFTEERRTYYGLDGLWGDAPKLDAAALGIDEGDSL
ncbi:MAG: ribosome silencing factor [Thermoanaerobaculales bacterium]|jgi:ribosome-associated protein|nr:ribosome silencing factor [Thermoanaerobaculales bacterium]